MLQVLAYVMLGERVSGRVMGTCALLVMGFWIGVDQVTPVPVFMHSLIDG